MKRDSGHWKTGNLLDQLSTETVAAVFTAVGTVAVAILAIWGDKVRDSIAGPKLDLSLRDGRGDLNVRADGLKTIYYHIFVSNRRTWSPARAVRILVTSIEKRRPDGTYLPETVVAPLQLTWAFPRFHELLPTVVKEDTCDLGFLVEKGNRFTLSTYITPNNFRGYIEAGESMRVHLVAAAHNFYSSAPIILEISWDGIWKDNLEEMQRHFVVKAVILP
jgi:hypothetical protein